MQDVRICTARYLLTLCLNEGLDILYCLPTIFFVPVPADAFRAKTHTYCTAYAKI